MAFCSKCGEKLPDEAYFCPKCGYRTRKGVEAGVSASADEVREAFAVVGREMEKAFKIAAKEIEQAFKTAKENIQEAVGEETVVCPHCGQKNLSDAKFCHKCGKKLR